MRLVNPRHNVPPVLPNVRNRLLADQDKEPQHHNQRRIRDEDREELGEDEDNMQKYNTKKVVAGEICR